MYLQEETSPPCSKCFSRRRGLRQSFRGQGSLISPTKGKVTLPSSVEESHPGNGWGFWHMGFLEAEGFSLLCLLPSSDLPTSCPYMALSLRGGEWGTQIPWPDPWPPVQTHCWPCHFSQLPCTPGPWHRLSPGGPIRSWLCDFGQLPPSKAWNPHLEFRSPLGLFVKTHEIKCPQPRTPSGAGAESMFPVGSQLQVCSFSRAGLLTARSSFQL